jgi:hypothetical protein
MEAPVSGIYSDTFSAGKTKACNPDEAGGIPTTHAKPDSLTARESPENYASWETKQVISYSSQEVSILHGNVLLPQTGGRTWAGLQSRSYADMQSFARPATKNMLEPFLDLHKQFVP